MNNFFKDYIREEKKVSSKTPKQEDTFYIKRHHCDMDGDIPINIFHAIHCKHKKKLVAKTAAYENYAYTIDATKTEEIISVKTKKHELNFNNSRDMIELINILAEVLKETDDL